MQKATASFQLKFGAGEWNELVAEHARLAHAQSLVEGAQYAMETLSDADVSAAAQLSAVAARLNHLLEYDARLSLRGVARVFSPLLGPSFHRIGERARHSLESILARSEP